MNKIIKALLESKFPTGNIEALLEVVNISPNPEVAAEILCGLYEEPVFKHKTVQTSNGISTFISYDKWRDRVDYSYMEMETKGGYFPKSLEVSTINMENFDSLKVSSSEGVYRYIPTGKTKQTTSYVSLETWMSSSPVTE